MLHLIQNPFSNSIHPLNIVCCMNSAIHYHYVSPIKNLDIFISPIEICYTCFVGLHMPVLLTGLLFWLISTDNNIAVDDSCHVFNIYFVMSLSILNRWFLSVILICCIIIYVIFKVLYFHNVFCNFSCSYAPYSCHLPVPRLTWGRDLREATHWWCSQPMGWSL
ncbi:hypothetical protein FKM82_012341 [Ascaphus truei]